MFDKVPIMNDFSCDFSGNQLVITIIVFLVETNEGYINFTIRIGNKILYRFYGNLSGLLLRKGINACTYVWESD